MLTKLIAKYYCLICDKNIQVCNRRDFCIFFLIYIIVEAILLIISATFDVFGFPSIFYLPLLVFSIFIRILLIILSIKRLHDLELSGFWIFLLFTFILLLILPSVEDNKKYGKKEISKEEERENAQLEKLIELLEKEKTKEK